jgi:uncharacterized protein with PQ loop repeat
MVLITNRDGEDDMVSTSLLGAISLNTSFVLYLIVYLPQIVHNCTHSHLAQLSIGMHVLLYTAYCLDLLYGFSSHLQWQYQTVSVVGLSLLMVQHLQLTYYFKTQKKRSWVCFNHLFLLTTMGLIFWFFIIKNAILGHLETQWVGYLSRSCFLLYALPQILKNNTLHSTNAISVPFIYLNISLSILDLISAWCLDWGWPNKLASPIMVCLMLSLLVQTNRHRLARTNTPQACEA